MEDWKQELKNLCKRGLRKGRPINQTEFTSRWGLPTAPVKKFLKELLSDREYERLFPHGAWKSKYLNQPQPMPDMEDKLTKRKLTGKACPCGCDVLDEVCTKRYMR